MKAELKAIKGELAATKNDLKQVRERAPRKPSEDTPGAFAGLCHYCQSPDHQVRDCPKRAADRKAKAEAARLKAAGGGPLALVDKSGDDEDP